MIRKLSSGQYRLYSRKKDPLFSPVLARGRSLNIARRNHTRAVIQSRFTVGGDVARISALSSMARLAKNRSSTMDSRGLINI